MTARSSEHPLVREAAIAIISDCEARDDLCELEAIFNAVKHGTNRIPGLENGFRYTADPRTSDYFTAAYRSLESCARGSCGGDCDDASILVGAMAAAVGFKVGLRAYGPAGHDYEHVYAVVQLSKRSPSLKNVVGLDTTVSQSHVGWEPPRGRVLTAWIEE